jgi:hypothetical protein
LPYNHHPTLTQPPLTFVWNPRAWDPHTCEWELGEGCECIISHPTERLSTIESSPTNNRLLLYGSKVRGQGRSSDVKQLKASTYENAKIKSIEILASYAASRVSMVIKFLDPL